MMQKMSDEDLPDVRFWFWERKSNHKGGGLHTKVVLVFRLEARKAFFQSPTKTPFFAAEPVCGQWQKMYKKWTSGGQIKKVRPLFYVNPPPVRLISDLYSRIWPRLGFATSSPSINLFFSFSEAKMPDGDLPDVRFGFCLKKSKYKRGGLYREVVSLFWFDGGKAVFQ